MAKITVDDLLENGVHYGHRTSRWNPKMRPYIYGRRNDLHIIDLRETVRGLVRARHVLEEIAATGGKILWVGTKRSARESVRSVAARTRQPYVTERWLGGTLTNYRTIRSRLGRLQELEAMEGEGQMELLKKKEQARLRTELKKLRKNLEGIRDLDHLPTALVVVDPGAEHIAVTEANKMQVPVVAVLDTDCNPDKVDLPIPANDDAMRSVGFLLNLLAEAVEEGLKRLSAVESEQREDQRVRQAEVDQRQRVTEEWQRRLRDEGDRSRRVGESGEAPQGATAVTEDGRGRP